MIFVSLYRHWPFTSRTPSLEARSIVASGLPPGATTASRARGIAPSKNRFFILARLHYVIEERSRYLFKPMRRACRNHDHITLGDLTRFSTADFLAANFIRRHGLGLHSFSASDERRLAVQNIDNVGVFCVDLRHARLLAAARVHHVLVTCVEQHRALSEGGG